jgi:hypothetical protein
LLKALDDSKIPHIIKLLAAGNVSFMNVEWNAIAIGPFVQRLDSKSGLKLVAQVRNPDYLPSCLGR